MMCIRHHLLLLMADSKCLIKCISYNMHGYNQGSQLLSTLCESQSADFIFIQEHWLTPNKLNNILNFSVHYTGYGISAMDHCVSQSILKGRPWGGVSILVKNKYVPHVKFTKVSDRYLMLLLAETLFVNVYLPTSSSGNHEDIALQMVNDISNVFLQFPNVNVVFGGDMNTDLDSNSKTVQIINKLSNDWDLVNCNDLTDTIIIITKYLYRAAMCCNTTLRLTNDSKNTNCTLTVRYTITHE